MLVILGYVVVFISIFGGFVLSGGELGSMYQPTELLIIGGAGIGAFIVGNSGKTIIATLKSLPKLFRTSKYTKALYLDLMALMYRLLYKRRLSGMMSLERDIEDPNNSPIFSDYPRLLSDAYLMDFIIDYMRLMVSGNMNSHEIEALMDEEIDTYEHECGGVVSSLNQVGETLPAFGLVAAVMGVISALAGIDDPNNQLGVMIAHAMVGTFLGILLAYGFVLPLAGLLKQKNDDGIKVRQCVKVIILSSINGYAPQIAVEFGRKTLFSTERPSFIELEEHVRSIKNSTTLGQGEQGSKEVN